MEASKYEGLLNKIFEAIQEPKDSIVPYEDAFSIIKEIAPPYRDPSLPLSVDEAHTLQKRIGEAMRSAYGAKNYGLMDALNDLNKRILFYTAPKVFADFLVAMEYDAPKSKRFYAPRKHYLAPMVKGYQRILDNELRLLTISMPKRAGKALSLDTLIPTPTGWKMMGDIVEGDYVIGKDGQSTKVIGVYPQGKVPMYEVTFADGAKIKTCGDHLWKVRYHNVNAPKTKPAYVNKVISTKEMLKQGTKSTGVNAHNVFSVEYCEPIEYTHQSIKIDPYILGIILGDGSLLKSIRLSLFDKELVDYIQANLPETDELKLIGRRYGNYVISKANRKPYRAKTQTHTALEEYGLMGKHSWEKFIPEEYLYNTSHVRMELLRGLLDTDGYSNKKEIEYSTTSPMLAKSVVFLVRSLGGFASCKERMGRYKKNGEYIYTRTNYRIGICFPKGTELFKVEHKKIYNPKREVLYHRIQSIEMIGEEDAQCICVDNADHLYLASEYFVPTHNSTTSIMFSLLLSGLYPDKSLLMEGTGDGLVRSFYNGMLEYLVQPSLYHFYEIFPNSKLVQTNADSLILNLNDKSRFPTVMCRSIDARQVGLSEATSLLALDDCVEGREEAKNRQRLDQKWEIISGDVMGRALENTPIVMTGTRYSLYDPIGRMQEHAKEHGWNWEAIEIPALDLVTDESNYEWENHEGKKFFTTEYFREQRELLSEEQWESEFQQQPFEGAGRLFPADSLNYYFELPIDTDPDTVIAVCDTAESGSDYTALAVLKVYGDDVFVDDLVYDNSPSDITKPQCARKIVDNNVTVAVFESNAAGGYFSRDVEQLVKNLGGKCSIRTKRTISNKQTRIEFASDGIIKNFYFKDPTKYTRDSQYAEAMRELTTYVRTGKVPHDDFTDCMSLCENEIRNIGTSKAEVVSRKW